MKNSSSNMRYDDSAERQGRKRVGLRHHGDKVDLKHMTPKEYRNYTGGIWDGIERRDGIYNWTPHTWPNATEDKVDGYAYFEEEERRQLPDRRQKAIPVNDDRRESPRRSDEIADHITHIVTIIFCIAVYAGLWWVAQ